MSFPSYAGGVNRFRLPLPRWDRSLPFPLSAIPRPLHTNMYFVEKFRQLEFLRSVQNPFFIREVCSANLSVEMMTGQVNEVSGEQETGEFDVFILWAQFMPDALTLAYRFGNETFWFVPVVESEVDWPDLPEPMRTFYDSARLEKCDVAEKIAALSVETGGLSSLIAAVHVPACP
jgi:hypothetical protein